MMAVVNSETWVFNEAGDRVRQPSTEFVDDAAIVAAENARTLRERAASAIASNAAYLTLTTPTNAQNVAQLRTLTRECSALIRLALAAFDTTDDT